MVVILLALDARLALVAFIVLPVLFGHTGWFKARSSLSQHPGSRRHLHRQRNCRRASLACASRRLGCTRTERFEAYSAEYRVAWLCRPTSIYFAGSQFL